MEVDIDLDWSEFVGQGQRSRSNFENCASKDSFVGFLPHFDFNVKGPGQGQRSRLDVRSRSKFRSILFDVMSWASKWQITFMLETNYDHFQSKVFVCVFVILFDPRAK